MNNVHRPQKGRSKARRNKAPEVKYPQKHFKTISSWSEVAIQGRKVL